MRKKSKKLEIIKLPYQRFVRRETNWHFFLWVGLFLVDGGRKEPKIKYVGTLLVHPIKSSRKKRACMVACVQKRHQKSQLSLQERYGTVLW